MDYEEQDDGEMPELDEEALRVKQMFIDRDNDYVDATQEIVDEIGPTLLEALYRLFNVPTSDVRWLDFAASETLMILVCGITYDPSVGVPKFVIDTQTTVPKTRGKIEQTVRIGIPYELIMADPDEIMGFMNALIRSHNAGGPTLIEHLDGEAVDDQPRFDDDLEVTTDRQEFNPRSLTYEQKQQMLIFQHQSKGKVH
jgi:hypothetical protein